MAISGSKIFIVEATLTPSTIVWRVASGPGWATAGGQPYRDGSSVGYLDWEDTAEGITSETHHVIGRVGRSLSRMAAELRCVRPLPLG